MSQSYFVQIRYFVPRFLSTLCFIFFRKKNMSQKQLRGGKKNTRENQFFFVFFLMFFFGEYNEWGGGIILFICLECYLQRKRIERKREREKDKKKDDRIIYIRERDRKKKGEGGWGREIYMNKNMLCFFNSVSWRPFHHLSCCQMSFFSFEENEASKYLPMEEKANFVELFAASRSFLDIFVEEVLYEKH